MGRKRDYKDFIEFAKQHKHLNRTNIINEFRKQGGKVQKQKGLEILRDLFNIEKGTRVKTKSTKTKAVKRNNYIKIIDKDSEIVRRSLQSNSVSMLYEKIQKMFDTRKDKFIVVDIQAEHDVWSYNNNFSVFIPYNGRKKQGSKALSDKIFSNLNTYYSNLSKMYDGTKVSGIMVEQLKKVKSKINKLKYPNFEEIKKVYEDYGIVINDISIIHFK